jgi:ribosomal protein L12E/L44/L45/RPP1/RPP2
MPSRLFPLIRPVYENEPELELASTEARNNAELNVALERQIAFDNEIVDQLRMLALSDAQIEKLESSLAEDYGQLAQPPIITAPATAHVPGATASARAAQTVAQPDPEKKPEEEEEEEQPRARPLTIFFAIGVGLIATICLVGYIVWDQINSFQGADRITDLLNSANGLTGDEFEAVQTTTDSLKDWFLLKNEHFTVPKEFGATRTIACRVFQFHNADVGQVMAKDDRELLYFLFDPADLGVQLKGGKWEIVEGERLVGGVTVVEGTCFVVAFRGKHDEMQTYLAKKVTSANQ